MSRCLWQQLAILRPLSLLCSACRQLHRYLQWLKSAHAPAHCRGPDGSLYLLEWGTNFDGGTDGGLYRIDYLGGGKRAPNAVATATPSSGHGPLSVQFSSYGSEDPDGARALRRRQTPPPPPVSSLPLLPQQPINKELLFTDIASCVIWSNALGGGHAAHFTPFLRP